MADTTFHSQKFWQKVQTGATVATSTILGALVASQAVSYSACS